MAGLHTQLNGRYGSPDAPTLVLDGGRLTGVQAGGAGGAEKTLFQFDYRFGTRAGNVVLLIDNGALLEPQADHSLKFLESVYPRLAK